MPRYAALLRAINVAVFGRDLFWRTRGRISDSASTSVRFSRALGGSGTARNVTTVRQLAGTDQGLARGRASLQSTTSSVTP